MSRDPVCNMEVDESKTEFKSDHEGETVYFCSESCKEKFDQNPENYEIAA